MSSAADRIRFTRRVLRSLAYCCIFLQSLNSLTTAVELPMCNNKKIYVLDLSTYSNSNATCDIDKVAVVNPANGIVYTSDAKLENTASHKHGTHSAPWYVAQAIRSSPYVTQNIDDADIVYVDSYCYYTWWLAWIHTKGGSQPDTPGDYLVAAFRALVQSERWKRFDGQDHVFYDPHPGFTAGKAAGLYWHYICNVFKKAMHIVVERAQRNICPTYWEIEGKMLITPYVPNFAEPERQYEAWKQPLKPLSERNLLIYAKARCTPFMIDESGERINVGKKMRWDFVKAVETQGDDVQVQCTDQEYGMQHESFRDMLSRMQSAKFCLGLPGDAASVRRMSEMFMAGCLPVFAGPPYATMPLPEDVDYRRVGLYYDVQDYTSWHPWEFLWSISPTTRPNHPQDAWFWIPDADVVSVMTAISGPGDLVPHLRQISEEKLQWMFEMMESQRQMFVFYDHLTPHWSAVNAIISRMCLKAGGPFKARRHSGAQDSESAAAQRKERQKRARRRHRLKAGDQSQSA